MYPRRSTPVVLVALLVALVVAPARPATWDIETTGSVYPEHAGNGDWRVVDTTTGNDAELHVGSGTSSTGALSVTNGATLTAPNDVRVGYGFGSTATVTINNGHWVAENHLSIADNLFTTATVDLTSGTWSVAKSCYVGDSRDATGTVNLYNGADFTAKNFTHVGHYGTGRMNVYTGATFTSETDIHVGFFASSTGTVTLDGGTWTSEDRTVVGHIGPGTVNIKTGSTLHCLALLELNATGTILLDGGVLALAGPAQLNGVLGATANGGEIHVEIGSAVVGSNLSMIGPNVDCTGADMEVMFDPLFTPSTSDTFNLFDPAAGVDLATVLGGANSITTPVDWQLDLGTGVLSFILEPTSAAVLLVGGLVAVRRKRR